MDNEADTEAVKEQIEEIRKISAELRQLVYSAPSKWVWDTIGSAVSIEQIAETIESLESHLQDMHQYCDEGFKEATDALVAVMWSGLQTKNYEAIITAANQMANLKLDFNRKPFTLDLSE